MFARDNHHSYVEVYIDHHSYIFIYKKYIKDTVITSMMNLGSRNFGFT
jgi:hypothetical protein